MPWWARNTPNFCSSFHMEDTKFGSELLPNFVSGCYLNRLLIPHIISCRQKKHLKANSPCYWKRKAICNPLQLYGTSYLFVSFALTGPLGEKGAVGATAQAIIEVGKWFP